MGLHRGWCAAWVRRRGASGEPRGNPAGRPAWRGMGGDRRSGDEVGRDHGRDQSPLAGEQRLAAPGHHGGIRPLAHDLVPRQLPPVARVEHHPRVAAHAQDARAVRRERCALERGRELHHGRARDQERRRTEHQHRISVRDHHVAAGEHALEAPVALRVQAHRRRPLRRAHAAVDLPARGRAQHALGDEDCRALGNREVGRGLRRGRRGGWCGRDRGRRRAGGEREDQRGREGGEVGAHAAGHARERTRLMTGAATLRRAIAPSCLQPEQRQPD